MNNIIYMISLILLSSGIILMVIYITKMNNKPKQHINENYINDIYNERPYVKFKDMFNDQSLFIKKYTEIDNVDQGQLYL